MENKLIVSLDIFKKTEDQTWTDNIKQLIAKEPTSIRQVGDKYTQGNVSKISDECMISFSEQVLNLDDIGTVIEKHLESLAIDDELVEATKDGYVELSVVVYADTPNPGLHLSKKTIGLLNKFKIEVDIDMYVTTP